VQRVVEGNIIATGMAEEFSVFASYKIRKYQVPTKKLV
jgi:hypothetical protein